MQEKVLGILLAGGQGSRMEASVNKVLLPVAGIPCIARSAKALSGFTDHLILVYHAGEEAGLKSALDRFPPDCSWSLVQGGETRQESVFHGIRKAAEAYPGDTVILIHDGARPLVDEETVKRVIESVRACGTGIAAVPVADTVKRADDRQNVQGTLDRSGLWLMQTPQGFRTELLRRAHAVAKDDLTDDAGLVEAMGEPVRLVRGNVKNIKLTTREDWKMAEMLSGPALRTGIGFDAHRLVADRKLVLCGVDIAYELGLDGHSDADVALHALCDALLGAAALGDIGKHFPDTDERYRGVSSLLLTESTRGILLEAGYVPCNVDVTIIAQRPKRAPYIDQMRANVAEALKLPVEAVSVKATTTEKMGYEGRGEGISAQAIATVTRSDRNLL